MAGNVIIALGRNKLNCELLCSAVRRKTFIPCEAISDWTELGKRRPAEADGKVLLMIDASGPCLEDSFRYIDGLGEGKDGGVIPALFNLERGAGVEPRALKHGVKGFFYVDEDLKNLLRGIHALFEGETWIPRDTLLDIALHGARSNGNGLDGQSGLTHREVEILVHLSAGATNEEIAEAMFISAHTVKAHLYSIYKKIQVDNRFQAALWATKHL